MAVTYVQDKGTKWDDATHHTTIAVTLTSTPTAGNTLALWMVVDDISTTSTITTPAGWTTQLYDHGSGIRNTVLFATKVAGAAESKTVTVDYAGTGTRAALIVFETTGAFAGWDGSQDISGTSHFINSVAPDAGDDILFAALVSATNAYSVTTAPSGYTLQEEQVPNDGGSDRHAVYTKAVNPASGSYSSSIVYASSLVSWWGIHAWFTGSPPAPVADFEADDFDIFEGETVAFTDLSEFTPTSWAWTFGDGGTSTLQNPTHVYAQTGSYTVSLTATNAFGSDTETKTSLIHVAVNVGYEEPPPALALIEIYASEPGSARWDEAEWDEAEWSAAGWQDVTPESVQAVVQWGSSQPEMGILSRPSAGSWSIDTYDPSRLLDPANEEGPYFGDLEPGLPIRISHRGLVVRQGVAESISFGFADDRGFIRVQDNIALLANAKVPDDVDLGDTLYARARAAIAAAGVPVTVLPDPPGGDPALVPWVIGTDRTAWQWIQDAAESVLHIPYIDRLGRLGFRAWESPLSRARDLTGTNLIDLVSLVQYDGLFSVVTALDDDGVTVVTRASTPPPRYGARTYDRQSATPDVDDWLETVLADRVRSGRRWLPGTVYPLSANDVERFATIEAVELVSLSHLNTNPVVAASVIVVGGKITITAKKESAALWWFDFEAAETATVPLMTEDGLGFVLSEAGDQFLYPE